MIGPLNSYTPKILGRRDFGKKLIGGFALASAFSGGLNRSIYEKLAAWDKKNLDQEAPDGAYWDFVTNQYMFEPGLSMMNNGTAGAMPRVVYNTLTEYFQIQAANPFKCYSTFDAYREEARLRAAQFIGALPEEVTLLRNTTEGLTIVAYGLDMKPGDEVLMSNLEHPSGIFPWKLREKRYGIKIKEVTINTPPRSKDEILSAINYGITPRTRVILISHAVYKTGLIAPLKEICQLAKDKHVLVCADGAHCVGMLNLNMHDLGVDFYANSGYKWLGAPTGTGIFYVKKELQKELWPNIVEAEWENPAVGALKFSYVGRIADPLPIALGEAIHFQMKIGKPRIERRIKTLAAYLKEEAGKIPNVQVLTPLDPELSGGLTVLGLEGMKNDQFVNYMLEKYNLVIARTFNEKNAIRVSTHIFISFKQIDTLLEGLRAVYGKK
ncbi:MAG: aminotransferase class V-fold PLP-dependent enzyme [Thermodesulfobacteriota bacterium]